jgi:hypothetical protein
MQSIPSHPIVHPHTTSRSANVKPIQSRGKIQKCKIAEGSWNKAEIIHK